MGPITYGTVGFASGALAASVIAAAVFPYIPRETLCEEWAERDRDITDCTEYTERLCLRYESHTVHERVCAKVKP